MSRDKSGHWTDGLVRALILSLLAAAVPISGVFLFPDSLQDYEALMWLCLLVPAFLWAYERGWRGIATALAFGMSALSVTYAFAQTTGRAPPDLLYAIVVVFVATTLGIGFFGDRLSRAKFDAAKETLALQDPLTGLPNRRHAELHLEMEFAAAERGRSLAVVLFDIDHMHDYNLRNGRAAGDGVLRGFASLLRQITRRMDLAARYGPEEFISVLGGCMEEGAVIFAGRVQERLRAVEQTVELPTVSAGVACYRPEMTTPAELLRAAEEALVLAKRDGRDRVRIFGRESSELKLPDSSSVQLAAAQQAAADARARFDRVHFDMTQRTGDSVGAGRSAFLLVGDSSAHARISAFLREERFHVTEATSLSDSILPLQNEFDIVFVDIAPEAAAVADLIREIRARTPLTRVIGIPRTTGGALPPDVLRIRVDAHYVATADTSALRHQVSELLAERDALVNAQLRHQQLSNELRTKDREARQALAASEARYRSVVQSVQEVIFTTTAEGAWSFLNPAWSTITGFDVDASLGRPLFDFVHADEARAVREQFERLVRTRAPSWRHEGRWRTHSGNPRWIEMRLQLTYSATGELEGTSGVLADVTDRRRAEDALRQSEEYFRSMIENAADMMALLNADGTVRYVSPAVERVLGIPAESWVGTDGLAFVHPEDVEGARERLATVAESPGNTSTAELRMRHRDGGWRYIEVTSRNQLLKRGVQGIVINARDTTERHRAERALRESEELLLRAQKMDAIGRLAGGVAHDFNNLLTAIHGHADLLLTDVDPGSALRPDLVEIRDAASRATSLTRQLLAFSRRQVLQPRVIDLNAVVREMEKMLRRLIGEHIALDTGFAAGPLAVRADPVQLEQVLLNLIVNARDAMPRGGRVTITTSLFLVDAMDALARELPPGEYVQLQVRDTGSGMDDAVAEKAFDPFFTTKPAGQGTGLGLSTVYGIVKQSGGHVWLESAEGSGTTVRLLLPFLAELPEIELHEPARPVIHDRGSERILLAEDEKAVRDLAVRILERQGYRLIVAANGEEALELLRQDRDGVDLLLTDVIMPGMNGQDLAAAARRLRPDLRVIFMSGYNEEAVLHDGVLADDTLFLEKPFTPAVLLETVRRMLDRGISA